MLGQVDAVLSPPIWQESMVSLLWASLVSPSEAGMTGGGAASPIQHLLDSEAPDSGPHTCTASVLATEASLHPQNQNFIKSFSKDWRDSLMDKSTCCANMRAQIRSAH